MVFDRYLFKNLLIATVFITVTLFAVIFLTQSLRFLELVVESGASGVSFWILTILALPRFFEIVLPIALMGAVLFVYHKFLIDNEIVVMKATGSSPMNLARPAFFMAGGATIILWMMTLWLGPLSLSNMQHMRQVIKAQYSSLFLKEGVFNSVTDGLTVFIRDKEGSGQLRGLMIHDNRETADQPVTVLANRGVIVANDQGQQVVVYNGTRQVLNEKTGGLDRLDFERYTIDLPEEDGVVRQRWSEPEERTFAELLSPDMQDIRDREARRDFVVEAHRRIVSPLLAPAFVLIALTWLFVGPFDRRGLGWRIAAGIVTIVVLQGVYLGAFNLSLKHDWGLVLMYGLVFLPLVVSGFLLSRTGENTRRRLFFGKEQTA